ncbi:MAG: protein-glutamate O-methyltransferase CheR [Planctomycetes bacterium]|nr:protein-glutamate O-methyltransferase CheR [Planctomycetota bacterium]
MIEPDKLTREQFDLFRDFIYRHSGIRVEVSKITLVTNRIRRRLKANGLSDFDAYYRWLTTPGRETEIASFLDAVTTNETSFFRTPQHFAWFQEEFLPECVSRTAKLSVRPPIRVWSAACSTGQEPYSLAMCAHENTLRLAGRQVSILGTDISADALREAREGIYKQRAVEDVDPQRRARCFRTSADGETYAIRPHLKELIEFRHHNLMTPLRAQPFDCIFIRNVLIYFDRESKQRVVELLIQSLVRGGYLVVGPSEGIYDMLAPLVKKKTFLYQKPL